MTGSHGLGPIRVESVVERKRSTLPRYVVIPTEALNGWRLEGTTVVEVTLNGVEAGRRSLKPWGRGADRWFFDLTESQCVAARLQTGAVVRVELRLADPALPRELADLLDTDPAAARAWASLSPSSRRQLSEHVRAAKRPETRMRRARKGLACA